MDPEMSKVGLMKKVNYGFYPMDPDVLSEEVLLGLI
jgi:hypothetical protein